MPPSKRPPTTPDEVCRHHVEALARSGKTVPAYANEHGIKPDTLYRWRRRFRSAGATTTAPPSPRLASVSIAVASSCELVLRDGLVLRFPVTLPAATLRAWLEALRS